MDSIPLKARVWFFRWVRWKLLGGKRPALAPEKIPDWAHERYAWFVKWGRWHAHGEKCARPREAPPKIPTWAWNLYKEEKIKFKLHALGRYCDPGDKVPDLGPVVKDGPSILNYDLTHGTWLRPNGPDKPKEWYYGFDAAFNQAGKEILAPEDLEVTRDSSSSRRDGSPNGDAFYCKGYLKYWFAHLDRSHPVGKKFKKGEVVGRVSKNHEVPHGHFGVDGSHVGVEFIGNTNYTHGKPTIGAQLEVAL